MRNFGRGCVCGGGVTRNASQKQPESSLSRSSKTSKPTRDPFFSHRVTSVSPVDFLTIPTRNGDNCVEHEAYANERDPEVVWRKAAADERRAFFFLFLFFCGGTTARAPVCCARERASASNASANTERPSFFSASKVAAHSLSLSNARLVRLRKRAMALVFSVRFPAREHGPRFQKSKKRFLPLCIRISRAFTASPLKKKKRRKRKQYEVSARATLFSPLLSGSYYIGVIPAFVGRNVTSGVEDPDSGAEL